MYTDRQPVIQTDTERYKETDLSTQKCIDAGTAREDDKRKANDSADDKAELHHFTEQRRPKVHEHVTGNFMIIERNVAEETHLPERQTNRQTYTITHKNSHTYTHGDTWKHTGSTVA